MIDFLGQPSVSKVWNRYGKASANQDAVIEICVAYNKRQKWMSTRVRVYPNEWDKLHRRVINRIDAIEINKQLDQLVADVREVIYDMYKDGQIDIDAIPARLAAKRKPNLTFYDFLDKQVEIRKYGKASITGWRWQRFVETFKEWGKIKTFYDLTEQKIIEFDRYLKNQGMKANSRWHNKHKFLNSFIRDAQKAGLVQTNPYDMVKIDKGSDDTGVYHCLMPEEFHKLERCPMPNKRLERVRDRFVIQTYTCLSVADLNKFNPKLVKNIDGKPVYLRSRKKTKQQYTIPLLPPVVEVLQRYKGLPPKMCDQFYNRDLKEVARIAGLPHKLTTHWARHSGCVLLVAARMSPWVVMTVMGHKNLKTTQKYYALVYPADVVKEIFGNLDKITEPIKE